MRSAPIPAGQSRRIAGLDLVRAVAITGVVTAHATLLVDRATGLTGDLVGLRLGGIGVDLFFALSGWLIGGQLYDGFRDGTFTVWSFWRRRWLRTVPAYLVFLCVTRIIYLHHRPDAPLVDWRYFVYVQNLAWPHPLAFAEAWSLSVEEWFYLITPLLLLVFCRGGRRPGWGFGLVAGLLMLGSLVARGVAVVRSDLPLLRGISEIVVLRLDAIGVGLAAVWLDRSGVFERRKTRMLLAVAGVATILSGIWWISCASLGRRINTGIAVRLWMPLVFPLGTALLLPTCGRWLSWPWRVPGWIVGKIALISYSMYLCNISVMQATGKAGEFLGVPLGVQFVAFALATLAVGYVSYRWIERPFIRRYRPEIPVATERAT